MYLAFVLHGSIVISGNALDTITPERSTTANCDPLEVLLPSNINSSSKKPVVTDKYGIDYVLNVTRAADTPRSLPKALCSGPSRSLDRRRIKFYLQTID